MTHKRTSRGHRVLAGLNPLWPDLKFEAAGFQTTVS